MNDWLVERMRFFNVVENWGIPYVTQNTWPANYLITL